MFELPDNTDYTLVADWVELQLTVDDGPLSRSAVSTRIENLTGSAPDLLIAEVWAELRRRAVAYCPARIVVSDDLIYPAQPGIFCPEYVACLIFSLYGLDRDHRTDPKLFERLVAEALQSYLQGEVFVFGWPVLPGIPPDIRQRIRALASQMHESFAEEPGSHYKDRGVDVVGWKPFGEDFGGGHRGSQVVVLNQCATGANWDTKTTELPFDSWMDYIHWKSKPLKSFAVPKVIQQDKWHDISKEGGLLFDRIRILNLISGGIKDHDLAHTLSEWADSERENARL